MTLQEKAEKLIIQNKVIQKLLAGGIFEYLTPEGVSFYVTYKKPFFEWTTSNGEETHSLDVSKFDFTKFTKIAYDPEIEDKSIEEKFLSTVFEKEIREFPYKEPSIKKRNNIPIRKRTHSVEALWPSDNTLKFRDSTGSLFAYIPDRSLNEKIKTRT